MGGDGESTEEEKQQVMRAETATVGVPEVDQQAVMTAGGSVGPGPC